MKRALFLLLALSCWLGEVQAQQISTTNAPYVPLAGGTLTGTLVGSDAGSWGTGGINGSNIGATTRGTGAFTSLAVTGGITLASLAAEAANTVVGNGTGSSASPTALAMPSCSAGTSALTWTSGTGFGCNTISGGGTVTAVTVASANGFTGSSSGGATPALTLTTSINSPVLAGNGTALVAATTTGSGSTVVLGTGATIGTPALSGAAYATNNAVSAAGSTQAGATALTSDVNILTSVSSNQGVALPASVAGASVKIVNLGGTTVKVYPLNGSSGTIDGGSANASINLSNGFSLEFTARDASNNWRTTATNAQNASFVAGNLTSGITAVSTTGAVTAFSGTAIPAGGTAGTCFKFSSVSNFGICFGSGAPTLAAAQGTLYLRSDGTTVNNRAYINSDGSTTWQAITTGG